MGCGNCSTGGCKTAKGCKNNGSCLTDGGCEKLSVHDWLSGMSMPMGHTNFPIVEVRFKGARKDYFLNTENLVLESGELVAVESGTGGYDIGHVALTGELVKLQLQVKNVRQTSVERRIYRKASSLDLEKWEQAKIQEYKTMHKARKIALDLALNMKISDVDYQGDKTKATFYYTADGRVDFRELIKRLAEEFRVRIEMRQIGARQEASRLGGIGSCGRELCCSTWLTDFRAVNTSAARYQNLSLNTLKLAGQCGKLKCCLNYELDTYMDALRGIPQNIQQLETKNGIARLIKTDIFKKMMWFAVTGEENWIPLSVDMVREIKEMNDKGEKPLSLKQIAIEKEFLEQEEELPDYENVVGQDSITRLDTKNNKKKKRPFNDKRRRDNNRPNNSSRPK